MPDLDAQTFDRSFRATHSSPLLRRLWAEAMGDQYPAEVEPFSSCCWWLLGQVVAGLRLRPGDTLADLGCGRGGPGLWTARALSARLVGVDFSPVALELAASRAGGFLPSDRATFRVGTFEATGLEPHSVHGVLSADALPFAPDRDAALREVRRILVPGGRLVFTGMRRPGLRRTWDQRLTDAGFGIESAAASPIYRGYLRRLYPLIREHADGLRAELGEQVTADLLDEADTNTDFENRDSVLFVAQAPLLPH